MIDLPPDVRAFLGKPNPAVIATLRSDGQPVTVATWYLLDGARILVNMDAGRVRLRHMRRDPRVSLTVLDEADWSSHVSLQGRVVEIGPDEGLRDIDRLARRYSGAPFRNRARPRVSAWIEPETFYAWNL
jgi:PPOX class probable F420-dependent enzyme